MRTINPEQQFLEMKLSHWTVFEHQLIWGGCWSAHYSKTSAQSKICNVFTPSCGSSESSPASQRWLTFWSVAQRLSLSSDVQTQVSSLQHRQGQGECLHFRSSAGFYLHLASMCNHLSVSRTSIVIDKAILIIHTSFQAIGSVLKSELVSSTERRFL